MKHYTKTNWLGATLLVIGALVAGVSHAEEPRTIAITVTDQGYEPSRIELAAEGPVRLAFDNQAKSECAASVQSEALGIEKTELPPGETTVIEVTPEKPGEYTFACGMGMLKGTLIVEGRAP